MEQKQPAILIQNQYIKDLSMEIPHAPAIFKKLQGTNPKVNVEVNVEVEKLEEEKTFNVMLNVAVNGDVEEEVGDLLFSVVNMARFLQVDPEKALTMTTNKFIRRFKAMEGKIGLDKKNFADYTVEELDMIWNTVKQENF